MRRVLIVFGVLASGTALSFGAAAAVLLANPNARMIPVSNAGAFIAPPGKGIAVPVPAPMPMPAIDLPGVAGDTRGGLGADDDAWARVELDHVNVPGADEPLPQAGTQP